MLPASPNNPIPAKHKILVIDDEAPSRAALQKFLSLYGHETIHAASGEEGLKLLERMTPDLIFLDLSMPGMDGLVTLRSLHEKHENIQVIMLAAPADIPNAHIALNCGAGDFITKPVDLPTLKRTLQIHLGTKP